MKSLEQVIADARGEAVKRTGYARVLRFPANPGAQLHAVYIRRSLGYTSTARVSLGTPYIAV